ncbi:MAG: hypothetical protein MUD08_15810 [Cytophagales bacterium]|jgi:hypothetical protein|nr:hypothetical protein [Cytophagales bacterium]
MKKHFLSCTLLLAWLASHDPAAAQIRNVTLDNGLGSFGGNTPLPAQTHFQLQGTAEPFVSKITLELFKNEPVGKPEYRTTWVRPYGDEKNAFTLPVYHYLRSGAEYSFRIRRFRKLDDQEKAELQRTVYQALDDYVEAQLRVQRRRVALDKSPQTMVNDMNTIVNGGLRYFENARGRFEGFSDLIKDQLKQLDDTKVKRLSRIDLKKDTATKDEAVVVQDELAGLKSQIRNELNYFLSEDTHRLLDDREIRHYPVERLPNVIGVNVGYAAAFLGGTWDNQQYGTAPYAGVSFPLGNFRRSPFMNRLALSAGVFLTDVKDQNDRTYTGAYISKPIYLGLGYKFFDFVRLNAGAVVFEQNGATGGGNVNVGSASVNVRPFVGLSADFSVWIGVGNRNRNGL